MRHSRLLPFLMLMLILRLPVGAVERTLLIGPKTIGPAWRDRIHVLPEQFANCQAGDQLTLYTRDVMNWAQAALQNPANGQALEPQYAYFSLKGPARITITETMLPVLHTQGLVLTGHDYVISSLTHIPATEIVEQPIWRGPASRMAPDWSKSVELTPRTFRNVRVGDGLRFYFRDVEPGAAFKLSNMMYAPLDKAVDGVGVSGDSFTYYIDTQARLIALSLAAQNGVSVRVGGKGYTLTRIAIVRCTAEQDTSLVHAQRAPREYKLRPGEVFHGEKVYPCDWSGNLSLTAEPFQQCREGDELLITYRHLSTECPPQLSLRDSRSWADLAGKGDAKWIQLDGQVIIYPLTGVALDAVKTRGCILSGVGCTVTRIVLRKK